MSAGSPIAEPAGVGIAQHARRNLTGGAQGRVERYSERMHVSHRVRHCQRATGQHPVFPPYDAVPNLDRHRAEGIRTVPEARAGDRVGHERHSVRRRRPREEHRLRRQMHAVDDHLQDHPGADQRRADDAGVTVAERSHRVEQVRDGARSAIEGRRRLHRSRVTVAARDRDAASDELVDELQRAGQLGRERDEPHRARVEEAVEQRRVRIPAGGGRMGPETAR